MKEYEIVLTADRSFMSDYHFLPFVKGLRFASTSILDPFIFFSFAGPSVPAINGKALLAPHHTKRTEAALLDSGFNRSDVVIAAPENICQLTGPNTKIVSITVRDPLSKIHHYSLLNPLCRESYSSISFKRLVRNRHSLELAKEYSFRIVVEGPGAWQLANSEEVRRFAIDHIIIGEYITKAIPHLFEEIIKGEHVPQVSHADCPDINEVPMIRGGSLKVALKLGEDVTDGADFATLPDCSPVLSRISLLKPK